MSLVEQLAANIKEGTSVKDAVLGYLNVNNCKFENESQVQNFVASLETAFGEDTKGEFSKIKKEIEKILYLDMTIYKAAKYQGTIRYTFDDYLVKYRISLVNEEECEYIFNRVANLLKDENQKSAIIKVLREVRLEDYFKAIKEAKLKEKQPEKVAMVGLAALIEELFNKVKDFILEGTQRPYGLMPMQEDLRFFNFLIRFHQAVLSKDFSQQIEEIENEFIKNIYHREDIKSLEEVRSLIILMLGIAKSTEITSPEMAKNMVDKVFLPKFAAETSATGVLCLSILKTIQFLQQRYNLKTKSIDPQDQKAMKNLEKEILKKLEPEFMNTCLGDLKAAINAIPVAQSKFSLFSSEPSLSKLKKELSNKNSFAEAVSCLADFFNKKSRFKASEKDINEVLNIIVLPQFNLAFAAYANYQNLAQPFPIFDEDTKFKVTKADTYMSVEEDPDKKNLLSYFQMFQQSVSPTVTTTQPKMKQ